MKKIISALALCVLLTGCDSAESLFNDLKETAMGVSESFKEDLEGATDQKRMRVEPGGVKTLSEDMNDIHARRDAKLKVINKKISEKNKELAKVVLDKNLTTEQKKERTSVIQKEIKDLKDEKNYVIEMAKAEFRSFGF